MQWNRSEFYALSVGRLADRIAGAGGLHSKLPDADLKLSRDRVLQFQEDLNTLGFDCGEPDGIPGPMTRTAISQYQHSKGLIADGYLDATVMESVNRLVLDSAKR